MSERTLRCDACDTICQCTKVNLKATQREKKNANTNRRESDTLCQSQKLAKRKKIQSNIQQRLCWLTLHLTNIKITDVVQSSAEIKKRKRGKTLQWNLWTRARLASDKRPRERRRVKPHTKVNTSSTSGIWANCRFSIRHKKRIILEKLSLT